MPKPTKYDFYKAAEQVTRVGAWLALIGGAIVAATGSIHHEWWTAANGLAGMVVGTALLIHPPHYGPHETRPSSRPKL